MPREIEYKEIGKLSNVICNNIKLREWVTNVPTTTLEDLCLTLVNRLAYKQAIKKVNNPQKAKKLIVSGLHECKRTLTTTLDAKKCKVLIVTLNVERNNLQKGTDDLVQKCITEAVNLKIPIIHTSNRSKLGRAFTGKFGPRISMISIVNFEGYQDYMQDLLQEWKGACEKYDKLDPAELKEL
jgi:ribosomal protein L7Ae-like RNA K-turn-binding protein